MPETTNLQILLRRRPVGAPTPEDFDLVETPVPEPTEGEVLVRARFLSLDPYMRGRMNDVKSYVPPFQIDAPMEGGAVGEVIESRDPAFALGDKVVHMAGWRDEAVVDAKALNKLPDLGVEPHEVLFLDDVAVNVDAARRAGWHAVLHRDTATSIAEMERVIAEASRD